MISSVIGKRGEREDGKRERRTSRKKRENLSSSYLQLLSPLSPFSSPSLSSSPSLLSSLFSPFSFLPLPCLSLSYCIPLKEMLGEKESITFPERNEEFRAASRVKGCLTSFRLLASSFVCTTILNQI
jgi:hypothetical protein